MGPEQFTPEKFVDPVVQDLIERIPVEPDPGMSSKGFQGSSEMTTKDGRHFIKRIDTPHGLGEDPLSDQELEHTFRQMASKYMGEPKIQRIINTLWDVDRLDDTGRLARMMVFE